MQPTAATIFNEDARLYDAMRPRYPASIFDTLRDTTKINRNSTILEVGCGTGQATQSLSTISDNITCIDPGARLLAVAREKLPDVRFENTTFEDYTPNTSFDLLISATAWHWVDPAVGYKKAHELLNNACYLAILHNYHIETDPAAFHIRAQPIYSRFSGRKPKQLSLRGPIMDMAQALNNAYFTLTTQVEYQWSHTYSIDDYIRLRNTYSDHRSMPPDERKEFEASLRDFANSEYDGNVTKHYTTVLFLAQKK